MKACNQNNSFIPKNGTRTLLLGVFLCFNFMAKAEIFTTTQKGDFDQKEIWTPRYPGNIIKENADCLYAKNTVNEATGSSVKIMQQELLIGHLASQSDSSGKPGADDSFVAFASLANYDNSLILYLRVEIFSTEAKENYGNIYTGDKLLLKLSSGEIISLESGKSEIGNLQDSITTYFLFYPIPGDMVAKMKKEDLVKVRIHWSKGYMDYPVANQDFFIRQLSCVE